MLNEFLEKVFVVCMKNSCSVSSWIRTEARNKAVGGSPSSQHLFGLACDLVPDSGVDWDDVMSDCRRLGLIPVKEGTHIHVQAMPKEAK